jgi:hypothetical protein
LTGSGANAAEADFAAIESTLAATERGRRFLAEYARRRREQDVVRLIAVADRIEACARRGEAERTRGRQEAERAAEVVRQLAEVLKELRPLADARLRARALEARGAPDRASGLDRRFAALVELEARDLESGLELFG